MKKIIKMVIETKDENGVVIEAMSFDNGSPQILQSVVSLLRIGYSCNVSVVEEEVNESNSQS